jgi:hypothetical protein
MGVLGIKETLESTLQPFRLSSFAAAYLDFPADEKEDYRPGNHFWKLIVFVPGIVSLFFVTSLGQCFTPFVQTPPPQQPAAVPTQ